MNILDRLEERIERLVEGGVGALFRSPLQPAEVGRKLERAMIAGQVVSVESRLAPNDYRVGMHPDDLVRFADYVSALCHQLERWLAEVAAGRGLTLVDRVRVRIEGDARVPRRGLSVTAAIVHRRDADLAHDETRQQTELARVIREATGILPIRLRLPGAGGRQREAILRDRTVTLGRAADNAIVLDRADVSRHHARFDYVGDGWRLTDVGSTNGTWLNQRRVEAVPIAPGDEIVFGATAVRVLALGDPADQGAGPA